MIVLIYFINFKMFKSGIKWYTFCTILYHVKFFFQINSLNENNTNMIEKLKLSQ